MKLLILKSLLKKLAARGIKIDPNDVFTQTNVDDIIVILKGILL